MSGLDDAALDRLLGHHRAAPPSAGLAERIRAEAMRPGREPVAPPPVVARPGAANRRRWARPRWWVGVASVNLALAGAAAASIEVAHHGLTRIAAIPAAVFHRVTGTPAPHLHHAVVATPVAVRSASGGERPVEAAPLAVAHPPIVPVRAAAPMVRQPPQRSQPFAEHHPVAARATERHRPHEAAALPRGERHAAVADRHRAARPEHPASPPAIAEHVEEAAKVREANLASRASMTAAESRPATASAETGERPRGFQRQPQRAARADGLPNRPAAARGGPWAQWRQQAQQHPKKPPPRANQGQKRGGKRGLFRRRG